MEERKKKAVENVKNVGSIFSSRDDLYKEFCEAEKNHSKLRDVIESLRSSATLVIRETDLEWVRSEREKKALEFATRANKSGIATSALFDKCPEAFHWEATEKAKNQFR
jgi:hypothetical protein